MPPCAGQRQHPRVTEALRSRHQRLPGRARAPLEASRAARAGRGAGLTLGDRRQIGKGSALVCPVQAAHSPWLNDQNRPVRGKCRSHQERWKLRLGFTTAVDNQSAGVKPVQANPGTASAPCESGKVSDSDIGGAGQAQDRARHRQRKLSTHPKPHVLGRSALDPDPDRWHGHACLIQPCSKPRDDLFHPPGQRPFNPPLRCWLGLQHDTRRVDHQADPAELPAGPWAPAQKAKVQPARRSNLQRKPGHERD